ncbi:MAG: glucokinase [Candidatus Rokuibacteriota bacterium]|nr:MAG: glucokinase [Candidatus Rokubacteria bacterium]
MILAGDVGGTKTALALFDERGRDLALVREEVLPSHGFAALEDAIGRFLSIGPRVSVDAACFGVAGPVIGGRSTAMNLPWVVDEATLGASVSTERVKLLNDLEATGHGVLALPSSSLLPLQTGASRAGNMVLIAAGTGLGEVLLVWDGKRHRVVGSEGGHADFAPRTDLEVELFRFLRREFGRVSYERVISGPGFYNIYRFLRASDGSSEPEWLRARMEGGDPSAVIAEAALTRSDSRAVQALDMFVSIYGAEAGNLALKALAVEGVFIGGGIAPKIQEKLLDGTFVSAFRDKGRLTPLMAAIPVHLVLEPRAALLGAAAIARSLLSRAAPGARRARGRR